MWRTLPFENCIQKVKTPFKLPKKECLEHGRYPVVSQEATLISGYHDDASHLFNVDEPVVIFGDHTQALKYIDFSFVMGADGVKILKPINDIDAKYFYYALTTLMPKGKGYARHYRLLKELNISFPPLAEQQRIVAKLDAAFAEIDKAVELTNENLQLADQSTESFLADMIVNADSIRHKKLGEACNFSQGVQVPKPEQSETLSDEHPQRFLRIIDFTSEGMEPPRYISHKGEKYHMTENDVALVRYGNPGFVCRGLEGTLANNLFKVIPRTDELDNSYLYYFLKSGLFQKAIRLKAHGVAMQAISFSLISDIELLLPPTELQKKIANKAEAIEATLLQLEDYYSEKLHLLERLKSSLLAQELQPPQSEAA